jgi:hypothetical protein
VRDDALWISRNGRRAILEVDDLAVLDSFQFFGPNQTPASISCRVEWRASDGFVARGKGNTVPPTDPAAFLGDIARARSTGFFEGSEFGFAFEARGDTDPRGYAQMGRERIGVFLS